ncbi:MAG: hypothetical protein ACIAQZ_02885 [Sedimentisphaeraceae bacterium JB056]
MSDIAAIKQEIQFHIDADEYDSAIGLLSDLLNETSINEKTQVWALRLRAHCYSWCAGMDDAASVEEDIPEADEADEDVEKALSDLNRVLQMPSLTSQERVEVLFERITELRWLARYEDAVQDCCRILDTSNLDIDDVTNAYFTRADLYLCLEQSGKALDDLGAILSNDNILQSTRAETLEFRADVWVQAGEIYKALDDLEVAMDIFKSMEYACGIKRVAEKIYAYSSMV